MKTLLIFPPTSTPATFYLSVPFLVGQLEKNGFLAQGLDLNIEFYNYILCKDYIIKTKHRLEKIINSEKKNSDKYNFILENFSDSKNTNIIINYIDDAVQILKSKKYYYNPKLLMRARYIINKALTFISLPYYPTILSYGKIKYNFDLNYDNIKKYCCDETTNIFLEYFQQKIDTIIEKDIDLIGISVPYDYNICSAFTLAKLLKEKTNAHITLGGHALTYNKESLLKYPEIFNMFCDSVLIREGEDSIIELANHIQYKTSIENVSGIIYKNNNIVKETPPKSLSNINSLASLSLEGYDLDKYFTPDILVPFKFSHGCYWGKCVFCGFPHSNPIYCTKKAEKVADELQELNKKYKIKNFLFSDDSIHPIYFEKLADEIIKRRLKIQYGSYMRLEKDFTKKLLKKLYKSGLRHAFWGLESASPNVLKKMNKGIDISHAPQIIQDAYGIGIWNHVSIIVGFPSETDDDFQQTYNFCLQNKKYIDSYSLDKFQLIRHSIANKINDELGIKSFSTEDFSCTDEYVDVNLSYDEKNYRYNRLNEDFIQDKISTLEHLLRAVGSNALYMYKYGKKWIFREKIN